MRMLNGMKIEVHTGGVWLPENSMSYPEAGYYRAKVWHRDYAGIAFVRDFTTQDEAAQWARDVMTFQERISGAVISTALVVKSLIDQAEAA